MRIAPVGIYLFKGNNGYTRIICGIFIKLTIKTLLLTILPWLLTLNRFVMLFWCFYCWLWTSKYRLGYYIVCKGVSTPKNQKTTKQKTKEKKTKKISVSIYYLYLDYLLSFSFHHIFVKAGEQEPLKWTNCREIQLIMKLKTFFILKIGLNN